jgi:hypothetical protein
VRMEKQDRGDVKTDLKDSDVMEEAVVVLLLRAR